MGLEDVMMRVVYLSVGVSCLGCEQEVVSVAGFLLGPCTRSNVVAQWG